MCDTKTAVEALATIPAPEIDAERLAEAARLLSEVWQNIVRTVEEVAGSLGNWLKAVAAEVEAQHEMETALRWASCYYRPAFHRYHHTKKKRIRKKYAKRILEWYRTEVVANDLRNI